MIRCSPFRVVTYRKSDLVSTLVGIGTFGD